MNNMANYSASGESKNFTTIGNDPPNRIPIIHAISMAILKPLLEKISEKTIRAIPFIKLPATPINISMRSFLYSSF